MSILSDLIDSSIRRIRYVILYVNLSQNNIVFNDFNNIFTGTNK